MGDPYKRSGMIPAFGDWDVASELPITPYFQCARQAGLVRYSSSSGESEPYNACGDLYAVDYKKTVPPAGKTREREKLCPNGKESSPPTKEQRKEFDVTEQPRNLKFGTTAATSSKHLHQKDIVLRPCAVFGCSTASDMPPHAKPVDEDLYKIPPDLLHDSKRKKNAGILFKVPSACCLCFVKFSPECDSLLCR